MLMASDLVRRKLEDARERHRAAGTLYAAGTYHRSLDFIDDAFSGRQFGVAVAVLIQEYQAMAARADNEEARLAWYGAVAIVEETMQELGSY